MTRAIVPAVHTIPTAAPSRPATRQTKSSEDPGFAHQLATLLQPRAAAPTAPPLRRSPVAPADPEAEEPQDDQESNENSHAATNGTPSPATQATSQPSTQSASTAQAASSPTAHAAAGPTDGSLAMDGTITALAGWITMKGELAIRGANLDAGRIAPSETSASQSSALLHAANGSDRSPSALPQMPGASHDTQSSERMRETAHATSESATSDTQETESSPTPPADVNSSASTQAGDVQQLPTGVTVLALSSASADVDETSGGKDADASTSAAGSTIDGAIAGALTASAAPPDPASPTTTTSTGTAAPTPGPDVTTAMAANTIATALSDRITMQLPTDQGSARIQIAVSNGTVVTRIMMPDATSAAHLSAASSELHDALARQGFDAIKIAVPAPTASGPSPLGHSEQSSDRTPDRAPQQSFTSAQDQQTAGRSQQRPRRQRER